MIVFNTLFIPNVLQKPTLTIIIFFILYPNGKKKIFNLRDFPRCTHLNIFKKYIYI